MRVTVLFVALLLPSIARAAVPDITGVTFEDEEVTDGAPFRAFLESQLPSIDRCVGPNASAVLRAHVSRDGRLLGLGTREQRSEAVDCVLRASLHWSWPQTQGGKSAVVVTALFQRAERTLELLQVEARATNAPSIALGALFPDRAPTAPGGLVPAEKRPRPPGVKPSNPPDVRPGQSTTTGGLSSATVTAILRSHWSRYVYCWQVAQPKGERPTRGTLRFTIDVDGNVTESALEVTDAPLLKGCIEHKTKQFRFLTGRKPTTHEQVLHFLAGED